MQSRFHVFKWGAANLGKSERQRNQTFRFVLFYFISFDIISLIFRAVAWFHISVAVVIYWCWFKSRHQLRVKMQRGHKAWAPIGSLLCCLNLEKSNTLAPNRNI